MNEITIYNATSNENNKPYCSLSPTSEGNATALYNAMNNPDYKLSDFINTELEIDNIYIERVELADSETGEVKIQARTVLFNSSKDTFYTVSTGVYQSLKNICTLIDTPERWKSPIKVKVIQRSVKRGSMLTLEVTDWGKNFG